MKITAFMLAVGLNLPPFDVPQVPEIPTEASGRILLWQESIEIGVTVTQSQSLSGGDAACFHFLGQLSTMTGEERSGRCLSISGEFLFNLNCKPPKEGVKVGERVIVPKTDTVCTKVD